MKTTTQIYATNLTDAQWNCIKELIPGAKPGDRPRTLCMRSVINAIVSVTVTGCQWRMLPKEYPTWQSCYASFRRFCRDGTWKRLHDQLRAQVRRRAGRQKHPTAGALDSQSVKVTAHPGVRGYDAGKKVTGRKRHILVDTMGLLMAVVITAASVSDAGGAKLLLMSLGGACLGNLCRKQHEYAQAEAYLEKAFAIYEQTVGLQNPDVVFIFQALFMVYAEQKKALQAQIVCQRMLPGLKERLGPYHQEVQVIQDLIIQLSQQRRHQTRRVQKSRSKTTRHKQRKKEGKK